jgi:hypothetical protein
MAAELEADGAPYHIVLRDKRAEIGRGRAPAADLRVRGKGQDLARLFLDGLPKGESPAGIEVEGGNRQLRTLVDAFTRGDVN